MLGYKHRMTAHWRLLAVIWDDRRRKPRLDEFGGMTLNGVHVPTIMYSLSFSLK